LWCEKRDIDTITFLVFPNESTLLKLWGFEVTMRKKRGRSRKKHGTVVGGRKIRNQVPTRGAWNGRRINALQ